MPQPVPRIMLSAAGSGAGKTTMTAALLSALCSRGLQVQGWKCGPDYIDPMFHSHITGRPAYHADPFFLSEQPMAELVSRVSADADCAVFEGAMGFYDGIGQTDQASAYTVSQWLKIPVLLVVNPKGMGCSAAALCHGFQTFRTPNSICGILLNDIRSGMYNYYRELLERETGLPVLGYLPHLPEVQLESRHLGLMTAGEVEQLDEKIRLLGETAAETLELSRILELAKTAPPLPDVPQYTAKPKSFRLGVAQDKAFCFTYAEKLDGLYFCGGYPELYLPRLRTGIFLTADRRKAAGKPGRFVFLRRLSGIVPAQAQRQYCLFGEPAAARRHWYPDSGRVRRIPVPAAVYDRKRRQVLPAGWTSAGNIPSGRTPLPFWLCDADGTAGHDPGQGRNENPGA